MSTPAPPPDDLPPELLAGYVDRELDPETRAAVGRYLDAHPEAEAQVAAQREFSPDNAPLWDRAEPPEPSAAAWAAVRREVEERVGAARPGRARVGALGWVVGGLTAAAVAASAAWLALAPVPPPAGPAGVAKSDPPAADVAPAPRPVEDPLAGFAVLPMAGDDDVLLDRVPDTGSGWLPVGRHPVEGVLELVTAAELAVEDADPSPAWPAGGPKLTAAPGDAPMIFAAKPR